MGSTENNIVDMNSTYLPSIHKEHQHIGIHIDD